MSEGRRLLSCLRLLGGQSGSSKPESVMRVMLLACTAMWARSCMCAMRFCRNVKVLIGLLICLCEFMDLYVFVLWVFTCEHALDIHFSCVRDYLHVLRLACVYAIAALCICSCLCALRAADLHTHVQRGITCAPEVQTEHPPPGQKLGPLM